MARELSEIAPEVSELESLAKDAAVDLTAALKRAKIADTTYWRWKYEGREPLAKTVRKVRAAITELAAEAA